MFIPSIKICIVLCTENVSLFDHMPDSYTYVCVSVGFIQWEVKQMKDDGDLTRGGGRLHGRIVLGAKHPAKR